MYQRELLSDNEALNKINIEVTDFLSLSPRLKEILKQQSITAQQLEAQEEDNFENMLSRMCGNRDHIYWTRKCNEKFNNGCGKDFEFDKKGKPITYRDSCINPFCSDKTCIDCRIAIARLTFRSFFYAYDLWRKPKQKWLHIILGSPRVKKLTKDSLIIFRKKLHSFLNYMRKEYRNPHIIGVFDIAYDGKTYYLHFHMAMRLRGYMNEKVINKIALEIGLKYKRADGDFARSPEALIDYFSKRLAGKFEHENNKTSWTYDNLFTPEEYFELFYRKKKFLTKGFKGKLIRDIRRKIKMSLIKIEDFVSPIFTNNKKRKTCQFCENPYFIRIFVEDPFKSEDKPPNFIGEIEILYNPGIVKSVIEVTKIIK